MSAPRRPAAVLSVVALTVLAVVAATAVAGWAPVSVGLAVVVVGVALGALLVSTRRRRREGATGVVPPALPPVATLSTDLLGREWLRTSSALAGLLAPATREAVAARRQDTLDELERRDPVGFARWLADDSPVSRNPAGYVHGSG